MEDVTPKTQVEVVPQGVTTRANDQGYLEEVVYTQDKKTGKFNVKAVESEFDPRREIFWKYYLSTVKAGRPNKKASAIAAGFSEGTAMTIGNTQWFQAKLKKLKRSRMLSKAEQNISNILSLNYSQMKVLDDGTEVQEIDKDVLRVVADMSKTIATTLGKDEGYSMKTEVSGKTETEIKINAVNYAEQPVPIVSEVIQKQIEEEQEALIERVINENN